MDDLDNNLDNSPVYCPVYWASTLAILMDCDPNHHVVRKMDGRGLPTDEEIIHAKTNLDKAFERWLNHG